MSNLFQRQLSQGDQVNLQSPIAMNHMNNQHLHQKSVKQFSPLQKNSIQNKTSIQIQNQNHLTSLTHASSEASLIDSSIAYNNMFNGSTNQQNQSKVTPFTNHPQNNSRQQYNLNKENNSPIFFQQQQYPFGQDIQNQSNMQEYIPTKLFTQEFMNQNKSNNNNNVSYTQQQPSQSPLSQRSFNINIENPQRFQSNQMTIQDNENNVRAKNDYFNSLKKNPQQQYIQNQIGFGISNNNNNNNNDEKNQIDEINNNYNSQIRGISPVSTPKNYPSSTNIHNPLDRPLSAILENAINKAISQSERVIINSTYQNDQQQQLQLNFQSHNPYSLPEISNQELVQINLSQQPSIVSPNNYSNNSSLHHNYMSNNEYNQNNNQQQFQQLQNYNTASSSNLQQQTNYQTCNSQYNLNSYNNYDKSQNNLNQSSSIYVEENYQNRLSQSPMNQQSNSINLNNSCLSINNGQSRPSQKGSSNRLTLVERQTMNKSTSRSPSKSTHHINCKYPNGESNHSDNVKQLSKKKTQTYTQIHNNSQNNISQQQISQQQLTASQYNSQQQQLQRSKSNNSLIPTHSYLKKSTRDGSLNSTSQQGQLNNNKQINSNSKQSNNLNRGNSHRSPQPMKDNWNNSHNLSHQSARTITQTTTPHTKRDISPNFNSKKLNNDNKSNSQLSQQQKPRELSQNQIYSNQDNHNFSYHKQNISTIVPNLDYDDSQLQQQQQQFNNHYNNQTPHSMSNVSLNLSQNTSYLPQQYVIQQIPYISHKNTGSQSPIMQKSATPRSLLNKTDQFIFQNQSQSQNFPIDLNQMQQIITNYDVQAFLKFHFIVGETTQQLICGSWHSIPLVYFIKLLITEFPEVLEDHQIGETLLAELKEKITSLVQDDENQEFVNLFKLQTYTKTTGLLGLILKALKDLSIEESTRINIQNNQMQQKLTTDRQSVLIQQQQNQNNNSVNNLSQYASNMSALPTNQPFFDNFKTIFQNSLEKNSVQYNIQSKDVQNIINIIQEFVEGLYRDMENEIYSKFNVEMRRLMLKFKETEQLLKVAQDKVTENYGQFSQEACQVKKIKDLQKEKSELTEQLNEKEFENQKLKYLVKQLTSDNNKLTSDNDKLHQKCETYLEFGMKNVQTIYQNNLQDQYQQLVQQQKSFFDQQIKQLEDYKLRQSQQKNNGQSTNNNDTLSYKANNHRINTDASDTESCNLSYALMTLEDQSKPINTPFQSSSKIPQQAIKALTQLEVHQNQNAFKKNKMEGQTLEPILMNNSEFQDSSDKVSLFKALNTFLSQCQTRDFAQINKRSNLSYEQNMLSLINSDNNNTQSFAINAATITTGRYGMNQFRGINQINPMTLDQAIEKLQSLIEILPLIREVRLFNYEQITNFLKYLYNLQMYIYSQTDYKQQQQQSFSETTSQDNNNNSNSNLNKPHISSIPINKCWKKILAEHNNKDFFCSFIESNNNIQSFVSNNNYQNISQKKTLQPSASATQFCLTPKSKPEIMLMKQGNEGQDIFEQNHQKQETSNLYSGENNNRFHPNHLIINNQAIIDTLIFVLNQHLQKIISWDRQNNNNEAKTKYFLLKMLIYLNTLIISNNKNDIQNVLSRFFSEIQSYIHEPLISDFVRDNNVLDVIFLSLRNINFANTSIVSEALQFLISFKQASSNYMAFIRQLSQESNMTVLLQLLECQFDSKNILMVLNLIKNVSYSINFKDNIQAKIKQVIDKVEQRSNDRQEKGIDEIVKVIRSNINCGVNIRTITLAPSQSNISHPSSISH